MSSGDVTIFICGGPPPRKCSTPNCEQAAAHKCSFPVTRNGQRGTCDADLCDRCRKQDDGKSYCPPHVRLVKRMVPPLKERLDPKSRSLGGVGALVRGANGEALCRWCGKPVPKGRQTMCSEACVRELMIRNDPSYARRMVEKRDRGVCALCGFDAMRIEKLVERLSLMAAAVQWYDMHGVVTRYCPYDGYATEVEHPAAAKARRNLELALAILSMWAGHPLTAVNQVMRAGRFHRYSKLKHSLWQADHVKPVAEGGGQCGLEGLRTLCLRCHKLETAALAARLALARNPQGRLPL